MNQEDKYYVFYSRIPNSNAIFPDGTLAAFVGGRFTTQDEGKAAYLTAEIAKGHAQLFIDPEKMTMSEAELDPMAELKARIIAEYEATKIAGDKNSDKGSSEQGKLNVADSNSVGAGAADSSSGAEASTPGVKLSALLNK